MLRTTALALALTLGALALPPAARADWTTMTSAGPVTYRFTNGQLYAYGASGVLAIYRPSLVWPGTWELVTVTAWNTGGGY
jgi:hypothetical protein